MKKHLKTPSIEQFRHVVTSLKRNLEFVGLDENGEAIFDTLIDYPILKVTATEKIHGTNAGFAFYNDSEEVFWTQSKENIITPEKDNAGFAFWAYGKQEILKNIIKRLAEYNNIDLKKNIVVLYGEWAGGSIQKNTAVQGLTKSFFIFKRFRVTSIDSGDTEYFDTCIDGKYIDDTSNDIYNVSNFPTYEFDLDLNRPDIFQTEIVNLVETKIEPASPLGQQLGFPSNVGEGVVCEVTVKDRTSLFKVKGEKHSKSKVKKLKKIDNELENKKIEVANEVSRNWRLEQGFQEANDTLNGGEPDIRNIGKFLKWINLDIIKEESDIIREAGFEPKDIFRYSTDIAKKWYFEQLKKV